MAMDGPSAFGLDDLVRDPNFDFLSVLNSATDNNELNFDFLSSDTDSPYIQSSFSTAYFDTLQLSEKFQHNNKISLMSLNIQSLPSKYEQLKELISDLSLKGCTPDVMYRTVLKS
jgi:hypothetical protein